MLKYKVNFYLYQPSKVKPEYSTVRVSVSFSGKRVFLYTNVSVEIARWDPIKQRSKDRYSEANAEFSEMERIIDDIFRETDYNEYRYPTPTELKKRFNHLYKRQAPEDDSPLTVVQAFDEFIAEVSVLNHWSDNTIKKYTKSRNHFNFYQPTLPISQLQEKHLLGFITYFQTAPKRKDRSGRVIVGKPHRNMTTKKDMIDFVSFLKWASKKRYITSSIYEDFKPKFAGTQSDINDIIYFTPEQLDYFYNYEFTPAQQHLEHVRDVIAFCCFSSLRFSDVRKLKKTDIKNDSFQTVTKKTHDKLKINLNDYSRAILEKYADQDLGDDKALPVISEQKTNGLLKTIGQLLGFDHPTTETYFVGNKRFDETRPFYERMTTHMGRRTFVVVGISLGIPETVIMQFTGHKDYESMKPYISVMESQKAEAMKRFNAPKNTKNK